MKRPRGFAVREPAGPWVSHFTAPRVSHFTAPVRPFVAPNPWGSATVGPLYPAGSSGLDPVRQLLEDLRGHVAVLQVGEVFRKGRILSTNPLVLVDEDGKATLIRVEAVTAVEF
jgi:hypothetical protein